MQPIARKKEWFGEWFDSPYYHLLYQHRDQQEARLFLDAVVRHYDIPLDTRILDLACGKGRHSFYLHSLGYEVEGVDLSPESIRHASLSATERLHFAVHDMRKVYKASHFDWVMNLFTSFGYFEDDDTHRQVITCMAKNLHPGGHLLIDFFDLAYVLHGLVPLEEVVRQEIRYEIRRWFDGQYVRKQITVLHHDGQVAGVFEEKVRGFLLKDFEGFLADAGIRLLACHGGYDLSPYIESLSPRLIMVGQKI